jgi:hypothetical protein
MRLKIISVLVYLKILLGKNTNFVFETEHLNPRQFGITSSNFQLLLTAIQYFAHLFKHTLTFLSVFKIHYHRISRRSFYINEELNLFQFFCYVKTCLHILVYCIRTSKPKKWSSDQTCSSPTVVKQMSALANYQIPETNSTGTRYLVIRCMYIHTLKLDSVCLDKKVQNR